MYIFPHQKEEVIHAMLNIKDSYENSMIYLLYMKLVYIENPQNYIPSKQEKRKDGKDRGGKM